MKFRALKYVLAFVLPLFVAIAFVTEGWLCYLPLLYAFGLIPLLELLFKPDAKNLSEATAALVKTDRIYDALLYAAVPVQYGFLIWFLFILQTNSVDLVSLIGRIISMGLMCGILGINVAHELGHRKSRTAKTAAKLLLLTSLYQHFFIEHNYGHHKNVSTPKDPASSRFNEPLYGFWFRSLIGSYVSAWRIQFQLLKRSKVGWFSFKNDMFYYVVQSLTLLLIVFLVFGQLAVVGFFIAALIGMLLLETVNYIEHYGLQRRRINEQRYENTTPQHSWNSDHVVGRMLLFELSRHSDHHANPYKKYQGLQSYHDSPQMPTGYPGMMLISAIPPLWFYLMNKRAERFR
jgi:alkane 1-monooxygenase